MSSNTASSEPETNHPPRPADENDNPCLVHDAEFYVEILHEIMQTALGIARGIGKAVLEDPATTKSERAEAALAVDRIARTIRRCILLVAKLQQATPIRVTTARARNQARARVRAEVQAAQTRAPPAASASGSKPEPRPHAERLDTLPPGTVPEIIASFRNDIIAVATKFKIPLPEGERQAKGAASHTPNPPITRHREPLRCEPVCKPRRADKPLRHPPSQPPARSTVAAEQDNGHDASSKRWHDLRRVQQSTAPPQPAPATPRNTPDRRPCPRRWT